MYKTLFISAITILLIASAAGFSDGSNPPAINLDGSAFICFFDMPAGVSPAAETVTLPYYFTFNQAGNNVWGFMSALEEEELGTPAFFLEVTSLYDGYIKNKKFSITMPDGDDEQTLNFRIQPDGRMTTTVTIEGVKYPMVLLPLDNDDHLSGIYIGTSSVNAPEWPAAAENNTIIGALVDGTKVTGCGLFINPQDPTELWGEYGTGTYNPVTGAFTSSSHAFLTGTLKNGKLYLSSSGMNATSYFFGITNTKKPKLKKPSPSKITAGEETKITLKYKNLFPGAHCALVTNAKAPKVKNADIYIRRVDADAKALTITVVTSKSASGSIQFVVSNADGKSVTSKPVAIK